jgi:hypothetical protein
MFNKVKENTDYRGIDYSRVLVGRVVTILEVTIDDLSGTIPYLFTFIVNLLVKDLFT